MKSCCSASRSIRISASASRVSVGTASGVSLILDLLAAGASIEEILDQYPGVAREDVLACIAYGSEMSRERYVDIPVAKLT